MKKMNDMVLAKQNCLMVIPMKVNIRMENDMEQERIDSQITLVTSVSRLIYSIDDFHLILGDYVKNKRHGRGIFFYPDGSKYEGNEANR